MRNLSLCKVEKQTKIVFMNVTARDGARCAGKLSREVLHLFCRMGVMNFIGEDVLQTHFV